MTWSWSFVACVDPTTTAGSPAEVVLNEWMATNDSVWQLADGSRPDWFELFNAGTAAVDLGRLRVTDQSLGEWLGPTGEMLLPGERYLVAADDSVEVGHANFRLSGDGDHLSLYVDGVLADEVAIGGLDGDVASARTPDGGPWASTLWATPGEPNPAEASPSLDPSSVFFGDDHFTTFALTVDPKHEKALDVQFGDGVPAKLTFEGVTLDVNLKIKGGGSFQPIAEKPAWKIDVNEYDAAQRLRGLKAITLNNGDHDPTFVRESIAYETFAAMGIPSMRVGWAKVTYNGEDYGLYVNVETTDDVFLDRWYADSSGMLLEGTKEGDVLDWELMEVEEGAVDLFFLYQLELLMTSFETQPEAEYYFEQLIDVDQFLTYAATEAVTSHWDGYQKPKNYHLYLNPEDGRLEWIPHGTDWTFLVPNSVWYGEGDVFDFCTHFVGCTARYVAAVEEVCDTFDTLDALATFDRRYAWLEPEILADSRIYDTGAFRDEQVAGTREMLSNTTATLREELAGGGGP